MLAEDPRVSMQEIAQAAGLHRATVHRHFASRDDLVRAVLDRAYDDTDAAVADIMRDSADAPAIEQLRQVIAAMLDVGDRWRTHRFSGVTPEVAQRRQTLGGPLRTLVARAQEAGDLRQDLSPEMLTVALGGLVTATLVRMSEGTLDADGGRDFVLAVLAAPTS